MFRLQHPFDKNVHEIRKSMKHIKCLLTVAYIFEIVIIIDPFLIFVYMIRLRFTAFYNKQWCRIPSKRMDMLSRLNPDFQKRPGRHGYRGFSGESFHCRHHRHHLE